MLLAFWIMDVGAGLVGWPEEERGKALEIPFISPAPFVYRCVGHFAGRSVTKRAISL